MNASNMCLAVSTLSLKPLILIIFVSLSIWIFAPDVIAMLRIFSPPLPMMRPSCPCESISMTTYSGFPSPEVPAPAPGAGACRTGAVTMSWMSIRAISSCEASPFAETSFDSRSICNLAPDSSEMRLIVSPPRPITLPIMLSGTAILISSTCCCGAPMFAWNTGILFAGGALDALTTGNNCSMACRTHSGAPAMVINLGAPFGTSAEDCIFTIAFVACCN
mmetsp:Transcript_5817/g.18352  ORF Transcript_5817/g.18352 Transcript_5817/m.18352 type:complete len:220 (-) Transcript_5817:988-1647(-)